MLADRRFGVLVMLPFAGSFAGAASADGGDLAPERLPEVAFPANRCNMVCMSR